MVSLYGGRQSIILSALASLQTYKIHGAIMKKKDKHLPELEISCLGLVKDVVWRILAEVGGANLED